MPRLLMVLLLLASCATQQPGRQTLPLTGQVVAWNDLILKTAVAEDGLLTLRGVRTAALLHLAMHDVFMTTQPVYESFAQGQQGSGADRSAAIAEAAYTIAASQYPTYVSQFSNERERWLNTPAKTLTRPQAIDAGITLGRRSAEAVLARRRDDGWDSEAAYQWHPMAPGVYAEFAEHSGTPSGFVFGAGWAAAIPFVLPAPNHFRVAPPPAINSPDYTSAFDEVRTLGREDGAERSADQTHLALWWKDFVENSHNRLARDLIVREALDAPTANRMLALLNMAIFDAYVSSFDNKFHYNHWRPYTAIRWAEHDGNPDTSAELEWTNTHNHTYAFPSYPSAHGTACAAAMAVLEDTLGESYPFTMLTIQVDSAGPFSAPMMMNPAERQFDSFQAAAWECALSRIYLGIHFRYDSEAGNQLGRQVGNLVVTSALKKLP